MQLERDDIERLLHDLDLDEDALREDYSGRSMYGRTCFGITLEQYSEINEVALGVALHEVFDDTAWELARAARFDSMGLGRIVYFPGFEVEAAEDDEDEDDEIGVMPTVGIDSE